MRVTNHQKTRGFTLVELLVVLAIVGILAALIASVVGRMNEKGKTTTSVNNLKQLHIAAEGFASENHNIFPATYWGDPDAGLGRVYWWQALAPYLYNDNNGKLDGVFRDPADPDVRSIKESEWRNQSWREISYAPWANGTASSSRQLRGISITKTERLSTQPYLTTAKNLGTWAIAGEGAYNNYVKSSAEWRNNQIIALYCDGAVRIIKNPTFDNVAPAMADEDG